MATNSRHSRDPRTDEGTAGYPMVDRRLASSTGLDSELFETLRDMLGLESRLRLTPPAEWRPETQTATERTWTGYGRKVTLSKAGRLGEWTLSVNGTRVLTDVSRREAFERAAEKMESISEQATPEV